jgi:replicative DNA helicase
MSIPYVKEAEDSVLAAAIRTPASIPDISTNAGLRFDDFYQPSHQLMWNWIVNAFYADEPIDPVTVGANLVGKLKVAWACAEHEVVPRLERLVQGALVQGKAVQHAKLIREASDKRRLLELAERIQQQVERAEHDPLQIASLIAQEASKVATGAGSRKTTLSYDETGQIFLDALDQARKAQDAGQRIGVWTGVKGIDNVTAGLKPGEVMVFAGEPGVGKSGVIGRCGLNFAKEQATRPKGQQVGTLILSCEMGPVPFGSRIAQMVAKGDTGAMRSGRMSESMFNHIRMKWGAERGLPLYIDYTNNPKVSQVRAIVAEAVRRHNVGFVILDHFKTFRLDQRPQNVNEEDEEKIIFLKYQIAQEMDVAVICLAHTRKTADTSNGRPGLNDLRGSGQIAAHADFVNFLYRPYKYASQSDKDNLRVLKTDAEVIWGKVRFGEGAETNIQFDPETMDVR